MATFHFSVAPLVNTSPTITLNDATLIAAIYSAVGHRIFSTRELIRHSQVDESLRAALRGLSNRKVGKLLHRNIGKGIERVGEERDGALWRVNLRE